MKTIDDQLGALEDPAARQRVLRWATEKFFGLSAVTPGAASSLLSPGAAGTAKKASKANKSSPAASLAFIKDLNLKPSGKTSFKDFAVAKAPSSNYEKCLVAVYYLKNE